jgi:hypothetical protein
VVGLGRDGKKRVLACLSKSGRENLEDWKLVLRSLLERGLRRVLIIVQDDFSGLLPLTKGLFPTADVQLCVVHMQRNAKNHLSKNDSAEFQQRWRALRDTWDEHSDYLRPMVGKLMYQAYAGPNLLGRLGDSAAEAAELIIELPRRTDRVLGEIERGNLRIWTRVEDVEPIIKRLEHMVARTSATILAAACIVGVAIVMQFYHPQGWQRWMGVVFWIAVVFAIIDYIRTLLTLRKRK